MLKPKIMVVEDEFIVATSIQKALVNLGYEVPAVVSTGKAAIKKALDIKPDLVLMDIVLKSDMDGITAARQIHHHFNIPIVYLTAYANKEILEDAKITEPYGYLVKPYNEKDLKTTIAMALHKAKVEQRREKLIHELQDKLARVKTLNGCLTICSSCKKICDDRGRWNQIDEYFQDLSEIVFNQSICPECEKKLYPEFNNENEQGTAK